MRNPSKNTIKRLLRPCNGCPAGWGFRYTRHWFFNEVGARLWHMSKHKIEHRSQESVKKYLNANQGHKNQEYYDNEHIRVH